MHATEKKIYKAFRKAATYCSTGDHPNEALAKSAREHDLNLEMTKRSAEMLNIFLTHNFMKEAKDKTAEFPIADISTTIKLAFTDEPIKEPKAGIRIVRKTASKKDDSFPFCKKPEPSPREFSDLMEQMSGCLKMASTEVDEKRASLLKEESICFSSYSKLIDKLKFTDTFDKFAEFEFNILSEYGEEAREHLNKIASILPNPKRIPANVKIKTASKFKREAIHDLFDSFVSGFDKIAVAQKEYNDSFKVHKDTKEIVENLYRKAAGYDPKVNKAEDLLNFKTANVAASVVKVLSERLPGNPY